MTIRFQRLIILLVSLSLATGAVLLILFNSKQNIVFFYTPTELKKSNTELNTNLRIGGVVKEGSVKKNINLNNKIIFTITDNINSIDVTYEGSLPDLFRERQGVVVEGELISKNKLIASRVFAKHDENYMPVSIKNQLEEANYWNQSYALETVPIFTSNSLLKTDFILSDKDLKNKIVIYNFFASWCLPCKEEHPLIIKLKNKFPNLIIVGFDHKDNLQDGINFLIENGNPYDYVLIDNGEIASKFGVFGLPETFLTNNKGQIIFQHAGILTNKIIKQQIIPNIKF